MDQCIVSGHRGSVFPIYSSVFFLSQSDIWFHNGSTTKLIVLSVTCGPCFRVVRRVCHSTEDSLHEMELVTFNADTLQWRLRSCFCYVVRTLATRSYIGSGVIQLTHLRRHRLAVDAY
jgi:hypothetical protein